MVKLKRYCFLVPDCLPKLTKALLLDGAEVLWIGCNSQPEELRPGIPEIMIIVQVWG